MLALLHRLPFHPRCWDVWEVGGGEGGVRPRAPAFDETIKRSLLSPAGSVLCPEPSPRPRHGEVWGGGGCAGSVRLAPPCSVTKRRIVRCRKVWIKVSGVGQVGRKTGMSWGLQRTNWNGYFSGGWVRRHGPGSISSRYFFSPFANVLGSVIITHLSLLCACQMVV